MPLPLLKNARRLTPWRLAACALISARRASYSFCSDDWGGGMNSSFDAIREGIGRGASTSASSSHWRTHMGVSLYAIRERREGVKEARLVFPAPIGNYVMERIRKQESERAYTSHRMKSIQ